MKTNARVVWQGVVSGVSGECRVVATTHGEGDEYQWVSIAVEQSSKDALGAVSWQAVTDTDDRNLILVDTVEASLKTPVGLGLVAELRKLEAEYDALEPQRAAGYAHAIKLIESWGAR